jgi:LacI family transcriptional regulator
MLRNTKEQGLPTCPDEYQFSLIPQKLLGKAIDICRAFVYNKIETFQRGATMRKRPTIIEVARRAGVSVGTVSNVLRGAAHLHQADTVQRVKQAIAELNYRPSRVARSLVTRRTHTIGLIVEPQHGRLTTNPYLVGILDGVLECLTECGYQIKVITLVQVDRDYMLQQVQDHTTDGVLLVAPRSDSPLTQWVVEQEIPAVVVGSWLPHLPVSCVEVDNERAVYEGVRYLIELGHQCIGMLAGPLHQTSAIQRERGYLRALEEAGIPFEPHWLYRGDYTADSGRLGVVSLLQSDPNLTAVVCGNDRVAIGALQALQERGIPVPERVSILGFDDLPEGTLVTPRLTTIHHPRHEIGYMAAQLLLQRLNRADAPVERKMVPASLVVRESVAPPTPNIRPHHDRRENHETQRIYAD